MNFEIIYYWTPLSEDDLTLIEALKTRRGSITMREICDELDAIGDVHDAIGDVSFSTITLLILGSNFNSTVGVEITPF